MMNVWVCHFHFNYDERFGCVTCISIMMNVWVCHLHFNYDERLGVSLAFQL
jgi:hypothetical protein